MTNITFRNALNSAVRYWEIRRLIYNGLLLLIVAATFVAGWPVSHRVIQVEPLLFIFVLAVLANIAYCAAYIPDLALQFTAYRETWLRGRWILFAIGTLMACAVTYLIVSVCLDSGAETGNSDMYQTAKDRQSKRRNFCKFTSYAAAACW